MKKRTSKLLRVILVLLLIASMAAAGYEYYAINNLVAENSSLSATIDTNTKSVYVATRYIKAGEKIESSGENANVEIQNIASGIDDYAYIFEEQLGYVASVDIDEGYPIYMNMVTEKMITPDERDVEVIEVVPMTTQSNYDAIDVRIKFPNGEDYLVLTNKVVTDLKLASCAMTIHLNEEEILRFQSACVDAYLTGGMLYTTRYISPSLQTEMPLTPDYLVRSATVDLISDVDTNTKYDTIVAATLNKQARREFATRLGLDSEDNLLDEDGIINKEPVTEGYVNERELRKSVLEERSQIIEDASESGYAED